MRVMESFGSMNSFCALGYEKRCEGQIFGTTSMESNATSNTSLLNLIRCNLLYIMK